MAYNILKHRRGTTQEWLDIDLVPEDGELVIEERLNGSRKCKLGDGYTKFSLLPYIDDELQDKLLAELGIITTTFESELENTKQEISNQISRTARTLEATFREETEELTEDYIARDDKVVSDLNKKLAKDLATTQQVLRVEIDEAATKASKDLKTTQASINNRIDDIAGALSADFSTTIEKATSHHAEVTEALDEKLMKELASEKTERKQQITELTQDITAIESSIQNEISPAVNALAEELLKTTQGISEKHDQDLAQLQTSLETAEVVLADEISELKKSIENGVQPTIDTLNKKITKITGDITSQHEKDFHQLQDDLTSSKEDLESKIVELETSVTDILRPSSGVLDTKITKATTALLNKHSNDVEQLQEAIINTGNSFEVKLDEQAQDFVKTVDEAITEAEISIESKINDATLQLNSNLEALDVKQTEALSSVAETFSDKIEATDSTFQEKLALLKAELVAADQSITSVIEQLEKQNDLVTESILSQLDKFEETTERLSNTDVSLLNKLYETTGTVTALINELSVDLIQLKQRQTNDYIYINSELTNLTDTQEAINIQTVNMLLEHITQFYAELADLVDDDIIILKKVFVLENDLRFALNELDERLTSEIAIVENDLSTELTAINQTLSDELKDISQTLTESIADTKMALTDNIEALRSSSNLKINESLKTINRFEILLRDTQDSMQKNLAEVNTQSQDMSHRLENSLNEVNTQFDVISSRIEDINTKLENQLKRVSSLISLTEGSTTGDAELIDIRNGYNGLSHETAGDAVRAIGEDLEALKASLPSYIPANAIDGLLYEDNQLYLTSDGIPVSDPVEIKGGSGTGSGSSVRVTNNLTSNNFTVAKGNPTWIDFTYTSYENEVPTGDGTFTITINDKKIDVLGGTVQHGVAKQLDLTAYLKSGSNKIKVTCTDQFGTPRSLNYTISVIELKIESTFNSARVFSDEIPFRYKVYGQVEKTVHIFLDGEEISNKKLSASVSGNETTLTIPTQTHGCHKLTAYISAFINDDDIRSNVLEYDVICIEANKSEAILASVCDTKKVTQGDLVTVPYQLYDPNLINVSVDLIVSSQIAGQAIEISRTSLTIDREQQYWKTRQYPVGQTIFTVSYSYTLHGAPKTVTKSHIIAVEPLELNISAEEDGLQLYLSAQGRSNNEQNPATWTFKSTKASEPEVTTTFTKLNWKSNGWVTDENGDTCLRLNGDARAEINFKPFAEDFKLNGKTIEFEFVVRDVNSRDAVVIDCFDGTRGFRATPDTAFLQSSGTKVSCRYKDKEKIRVAVSVEYAEGLSRFVSIYLDGILSGVQRYSDKDNFAQDNPVNISLGSNLCGLDIYSIRVYNKALETSQILNNYIADLTDTTAKLQLVSENDIFEDGKISYERVKALGQVPIVTFTGQMPTYKGDKKRKSVRMKFEDPLHPELNFDVLLDQIDVQGTSSQFYVRKNWKIQLPESRPHMPGAIPAKVYCIKVDYAEATGTHNTGSANYIETLYDRNEVTLPPQKDDPRVRTTIQGFPCIIFEKTDEDAEPVFSSKGNFNYDKGAEDTFGFTSAYRNFGVECWEFRNNTSGPVNFTSQIPENWLEDFEPRYTTADFERIEELQKIAELAESGKATMTDIQRQEFTQLLNSCIVNFRSLHDWVLSTATYTLVDGQRVPITPTSLESSITYGGVTYTEDNEEYRLAKFKHEFTDYFNMHYSSIYYVFTFFALMTDQRAKNMFLTRWKDDDGQYRWYPYFYDNDTIFGINNEGALVFDYYHEDTDQLGSSNVFNGQNSVLWDNFRRCFPQEIENTYATLRSENKLTYDAIIEQFVTQGSDKWSAAIYNEDADYKYISMARPHTDASGNVIVDASNLYQVRGPGDQHLKYFVANRFNYCDSLWYAGDYPSNFYFLRIYTPKLTEIKDTMSQEEQEAVIANNTRIQASLEAVPASPNITVKAFSNMYAGIRYKSGNLQQERLSAGGEYTFGPTDASETFSDTETAIYGASELASLGDLSGLYCGVVNLVGKNTANENATQGNVKENKLTELIIGNANPAYYNDNFREVVVGTCRLLRTIDLRNCFGLGIAGDNPQKTLDLTGCPNIEHIYTEGTNLNSVDLPESGYIKTLHLPASTNTLVIKNQQYITDFSIDSYDNIKTLCIENCPTLNTDEILAACRDQNGKYTVERVRLTGINWNLENTDFIKNLFPVFDADGKLISGIRGIDDKNNNLDDAYLVGSCYIKSLTGAEYAEIKAHYPYLDISFGELTSNVTFKYTDVSGEEHTYSVPVTSVNSTPGHCPYPDLTPVPAWPENDAFTYELKGWSREHQISKGTEDSEEDYLKYLHLDALQEITGDRTLYPVFEAIRKSYPVHFKNPTDLSEESLLQTVMTPYGRDALYTGEIPRKLDAASPDLYTFTSWYPAPENITGETTCFAQFAILDDKWYTLGINDLPEWLDHNKKPCAGYTVNTTDNTLTIVKCSNKANAAVKIPESLILEETPYTVTNVGGFDEYSRLELINLPDSTKTISARGFYNCYNLFELTLPENLKTIGKSAFQSCSKLKTLYIPASVDIIEDAAFADCSSLVSIAVDEENSKYAVIENCLIDVRNKKLIQGLSSGSIPQEGQVERLGQFCFSNTNIASVQIPEGVTTIPSNAFSHCKELAEISLPSTLKILDATCFAWCPKIEQIELPEGLQNINTYVFDSSSLVDVVIPSTVVKVQERSFGNIPTLRTVTFKKRLDADGNIVVPTIADKAFALSGANSSDQMLTFNLPWPAEATPNAPWGATNCVLNFNYEEEAEE